RSFSIPTTVPLTTEPSCRLPCVNDSSSILAKSSRDEAAELVAIAVAMNSPGWRVASDRDEGALRADGPKPRGLSATADKSAGGVHLPAHSLAARRNHRPIETMVQIRCAAKEARTGGLILHDGSTVSRAPGPPGRPRQCRRRPGTRRLYPNAWYRA